MPSPHPQIYTVIQSARSHIIRLDLLCAITVILKLSWFSFQIKIGTLEGNLARLNYENLLENPLLKFSGRNQVTTRPEASQNSARGWVLAMPQF